MPLEDAEWDIVRVLVEKHFFTSNNTLATLQVRLPGHWTSIRFADRVDESAALLVDWAKNSSPNEDPPFTIVLLEALARMGPIRAADPQGLGQLTGYLGRLKDEQRAINRADAFLAGVLPGTGEIFINRSNVRGLLRGLVTPIQGKPVPVALRVDGAPRCGKSYTLTLIKHLSSCKPIMPAIVEVDESTTARHIIDDLKVQLAQHSEIPELEDPSKRPRPWADWLVRQTWRSAPDRAVWFVFDQCNQLDPSSDAVEMIAQLAKVIQAVPLNTPRAPRLVLLGYGDGYPDLGIPRQQVPVDVVEPITDEELVRFFEKVFSDNHEAMRIDLDELDDFVAEAVREVLAHVSGLGPDEYMDALRAAAEVAVHV